MTIVILCVFALKDFTVCIVVNGEKFQSYRVNRHTRTHREKDPQAERHTDGHEL